MNRGDGFERIIVIVPMTGRGTYEDPRRPLYVPAQLAPNKDGILSFEYELTDDGARAIVTLKAVDRKAFAQILSERRADVKIFEPGKIRKEDAEVEIRKEKKDFDIEGKGRGGR